MRHQDLRDRLHDRIDEVLEPACRRLAAAGVRPNHVTLAGLALAALAALAVAQGALLGAGVLWLLAGGADLLDGALARSGAGTTRYGAFLDSVTDRFAEGLLLAAMAYRFAERGQAFDTAVVVLALLGSVLVSYTRARAEGLGLSCRVGTGTRAERVALLGIGLLTDWLEPVLYVLVAMSYLTVVQRVRHTHRSLETEGGAG